jgi:iron complex transport system substrate-binding protein
MGCGRRPARGSTCPGVFAAVLAMLLVIAAAGTVRAAPMRIVSANLCADRLVIDLVARERILSVSPFAADPDLSPVSGRAVGLPVNRGDAEEILALKPDLVVTGAFASRGAASLLRRAGVAVHEIPVAGDFEAARSAIRDLARRLGAVPRGEELIAELDARVDALPRPIVSVRAVSLHAGGWVAGGGSLADAVLARLGIVNGAGARAGFVQMDVETLVSRAPDMIAVERHGVRAASRTWDAMTHPAIARTAARRVEIPARDWACADAALAHAAAAIAGGVR